MTRPDNPQKHDFKYLEELIRKSDGKVILDFDIVLGNEESLNYAKGIEIGWDVVIHGNGHMIDAKNKSAIFTIVQGTVTLENITFKNAFGLEEGGAIILNGGRLRVENCIFSDNSSNGKGAGIFCAPLTSLEIAGSKFFDNSSNESACLHNFNGIVEIVGSEFFRNSAKENASAIINQKRGRLLIRDSSFKGNDSGNGGAILNFGKCEVFSCTFMNNSTSKDGAAISNQERSLLNIYDSSFIGNECYGDGGSIVNFSRANLTNVLFLRNSSKNHAAAISNQKRGVMKVLNSTFAHNHVEMNGGAIINWGRLELNGVRFKSNRSVELGGAIFNQEESQLYIDSGEFIDNFCINSGGAIFNWGEMRLADLLFGNNESKWGGAINSAKRASTIVRRCEFFENISENASAIFNNSKNTKLFDCIFSNHAGDNVIYNFKSLFCIENIFSENSCQNVIFNDEDSSIIFLGGEFKSNICEKSVICSSGDFLSLTYCIFKGNSSRLESGREIYNEGYMLLHALEFDSSEKPILNKGIADIKKMNPALVHNLNVINDFSKISDNEHDFSSLDRATKERKTLKLEHDYLLEIYESDFYEGGIEIMQDGVEIDGCGHSIDGASRSRIFLINAKNVVLKNIVFKNGAFFVEFDDHFSGGGAIHVLKDSSIILENCLFLNNKSNSNGGAIFNEGYIKSINCKFENNKSKTFGGAIDTRQTLMIQNNQFKGNSSGIAGAIYNANYLKIENGIALENNKSQFLEGIYNAGLVDGEGFEGMIFNSSPITEDSEIETFSDLMDKIETSSVIMLASDIRFDFRKDFYLKYKLEIKHDLTIDGAGHTIEYNLDVDDASLFDGANSSSLFRIRKKDVRLTLKNIVFRNCYSNGRDIIDNSGKLVIENCRFINSRVIANDCLISNQNILKIENTHFSNLMSSKNALIDNSYKALLSNVHFINNNSLAMGSCITNSGEIEIIDSMFKSNRTKNNAGCINNEYNASIMILNSEFRDNYADVDGGAIYNYGELDISNSKFIGNLARDEGGAINTRTSGEVTISDCEFILNKSKTNGGAIFNYGKVQVENSRFIKNHAKIRSGAIEHTRPLDKRKSSYLKVSNSEFKDNQAIENNDIYSYEGADVNMK